MQFAGPRLGTKKVPRQSLKPGLQGEQPEGCEAKRHAVKREREYNQRIKGKSNGYVIVII
jgi:hypothetical protein